MRETSLLSDLINAFKTPERGIAEFPTKARAKEVKENHNLSHNNIKNAKNMATNLSRSLMKTKLLILDDDIVKKAVDIFFDGDTDFTRFYKYAVAPYSNCFIEWNEKLRMEETLRQYMSMQKTFHASELVQQELTKMSNYLSLIKKNILSNLDVKKNYDTIIEEQMNKVNYFYREQGITGDIKVGFHVQDFYLRDYIGSYQKFPSKFQHQIDHKLHEFSPYVLGTNLDGKRQVFCNFNSMIFDPEIKVADVFNECILEQFILSGEKEEHFFNIVEEIKREFRKYSIPFFGSSIIKTEKFLEERIYFNWQNNRELFFTDYEDCVFTEHTNTQKVTMPPDFKNEYHAFRPFNMGAFLLICLGLLNHQKTEYIDVPSKNQKREISFGNQKPRKEYHLVKFTISDNPKKIIRAIAKKIDKIRKLVKLHERKQHYRKFKTVKGARIALPEPDWIRVKSAWVGSKRHGEIHKDWHVVQDG